MLNSKEELLGEDLNNFLVKRFIYNERPGYVDLMIDELFISITENTELSNQQKSKIDHFRSMLISEIQRIAEFIFLMMVRRMELFNQEDENPEEYIKKTLNNFIFSALTKKEVKLQPACVNSLSNVFLLYFYYMDNRKPSDSFARQCIDLISSVITGSLIKEYDDYVISILISKNKKNALANPKNSKSSHARKKRPPSQHQIEVIKIIDNTLQAHPKASTYAITQLLHKNFKGKKSKSTYTRWVAERRIATGTTVEEDEICKDKIKLILD
ncbi:hypothetical protein K0K43_001186 [Salmonella enterica]|nr:hypothetical protein [Salmonella enterica]